MSNPVYNDLVAFEGLLTRPRLREMVVDVEPAVVVHFILEALLGLLVYYSIQTVLVGGDLLKIRHSRRVFRRTLHVDRDIQNQLSRSQKWSLQNCGAPPSWITLWLKRSKNVTVPSLNK
jgi:hypothetical protein